jgi:hypothetical protein
MNNKNIMTALIILLTSISLFSQQAKNTASQNNQSYLLAYSFSSPIKSCYRWINAQELNEWSTGQIKMFNGRWLSLGRSANEPITYCFQNSVGAMKGGTNEIYGEYLLRIDFVDDAVIFDRNKNTYFSIDSAKQVPNDMKKEVSTEIVYANYKNGGFPWFQEYIIRDPRVIKSWSVNDEKLKETFVTELANIKAKKLGASGYHFYVHVPDRDQFEIINDQLNSRDMEKRKYLLLLYDREKSMSNYWQQNPQMQTFNNRNQRGPITIEP